MEKQLFPHVHAKHILCTAAQHPGIRLSHSNLPPLLERSYRLNEPHECAFVSAARSHSHNHSKRMTMCHVQPHLIFAHIAFHRKTGVVSFSFLFSFLSFHAPLHVGLFCISDRSALCHAALMKPIESAVFTSHVAYGRTQ